MPRKAVHTEVVDSLSDESLSQAMERGKKWVRYNLREWPYQHDLFPQVRFGGDGNDTMFVDFYFVPTNPP